MHPSVMRMSTVNRRRQIPSCQTVGCLQPYLGFCDASCSVTASARLPARKLFQRGEPKKKGGQASLGRDEIPFSAILYLRVAPALSPDEIRKVGQWRAKEGCGAGTLEAEREADEGVEVRWKRGALYTEDISPCLKLDSRQPLSRFDFLLCCSSSL